MEALSLYVILKMFGSHKCNELKLALFYLGEANKINVHLDEMHIVCTKTT